MVRPTAFAVVLCLAWGASLASQAPAPARAPSAAAPDPALRQTLDRYCASCHNERVKSTATAGGVVLSNADLAAVGHDAALWEKVLKKVRTGAMPPAGMPRPEPAAQTALLTYLESALDREAAARPNPGRAAPHRLNRAEYQNAIRDLLALDVDTATLLPPDDSADGFDNIADALGASPALLERYLSAAAKISALAVGSPAITADSDDLSRARRRLADRPARRAAARHARRPAGAPHVPARRRIHHQGEAAPDQPRLDPRHRGHASARDQRGRRARAAGAGGQRAGVRRRGQERDQHREPARGAAAGARVRARRPAAGRRGVSGQDVGARRQPAAVVRAQHADCHRPSRRAARRERDHHRTVQSQGVRRHREPPPRVHLFAGRRRAGRRRPRLRADDRLHAWRGAPTGARSPTRT